MMGQQPQGNPLAIDQQQQGGAGTPPDIGAALEKAHSMAKAMYKQTAKASAHLRSMNKALSGLAKMGDMVTPEEVVEAAGELVATGTHSPTEMATVLADMPQGGQALAAWIDQHLENNENMLGQLAQMHKLAQHEMGASALRLLLWEGKNAPPNAAAEPQGPAAPGNALMGSLGNA